MKSQFDANSPVASSAPQWPAVRTIEKPARVESLTTEPEHCQSPPARWKKTLPVRLRTAPPPVHEAPVTPPPPPGLAFGVGKPTGLRSRGTAAAIRAGVQ